MQLSRMDDVAGCRLIFQSVGELREFRTEFYNNSRFNHKLKNDPEAVSKILAQQDDDAGELHEAEIVGGMIFIADHQPPEVA